MKRSLLFALLGFISSSALAGDIFTDFGPAGNEFNQWTGLNLPLFTEYAYKFVPTATGQVGIISAPVRGMSTLFETYVSIWTDSGGLPGSELVRASTLGGRWGSEFTADPVYIANGPTLTAGTSYWFAVGPTFYGDHNGTQTDYQGVWLVNSIGLSAHAAVNETWTGQGWQLDNGNLEEPAFRISTVPEPSTIGGVGLALLIVLRRRRNLHPAVSRIIGVE